MLDVGTLNLDVLEGCAIGIHGQWLYVDPTAEVVIVRFASQPVPVDDPLDLDVLALFRHIAASA